MFVRNGILGVGSMLFHNNVESSKHLLLSAGTGRELKGEANEMIEFMSVSV